MLDLVASRLEVPYFTDDMSHLFVFNGQGLAKQLKANDNQDEITTILILEKLSKPSSVKSGVPSSMNDKSVRYMPR